MYDPTWYLKEQVQDEKSQGYRASKLQNCGLKAILSDTKPLTLSLYERVLHGHLNSSAFILVNHMFGRTQDYSVKQDCILY